MSYPNNRETQRAITRIVLLRALGRIEETDPRYREVERLAGEDYNAVSLLARLLLGHEDPKQLGDWRSQQGYVELRRYVAIALAREEQLLFVPSEDDYQQFLRATRDGRSPEHPHARLERSSDLEAIARWGSFPSRVYDIPNLGDQGPRAELFLWAYAHDSGFFDALSSPSWMAPDRFELRPNAFRALVEGLRAGVIERPNVNRAELFTNLLRYSTNGEDSVRAQALMQTLGVDVSDLTDDHLRSLERGAGALREHWTFVSHQLGYRELPLEDHYRPRDVLAQQTQWVCGYVGNALPLDLTVEQAVAAWANYDIRQRREAYDRFKGSRVALPDKPLSSVKFEDAVGLTDEERQYLPDYGEVLATLS